MKSFPFQMFQCKGQSQFLRLFYQIDLLIEKSNNNMLTTTMTKWNLVDAGISTQRMYSHNLETNNKKSINPRIEGVNLYLEAMEIGWEGKGNSEAEKSKVNGELVTVLFTFYYPTISLLFSTFLPPLPPPPPPPPPPPQLLVASLSSSSGPTWLLDCLFPLLSNRCHLTLPAGWTKPSLDNWLTDHTQLVHHCKHLEIKCRC